MKFEFIRDMVVEIGCNYKERKKKKTSKIGARVNITQNEPRREKTRSSGVPTRSDTNQSVHL